MARKKIDDQVVAQWIHQHRKGVSYRSIGREFNVDSRTVKSWIERAGEEKEKEHWEAVSRQVDAKYLDEHYRMLLQIAAAVLSTVHTNPVSVHHELDARSVLSTQMQSAVQKSAKLLVERGIQERGSLLEGIDDKEAGRLGLKLLDALMEHEPQMKTAIDSWADDWTKFQKERLELIEAAKNLFKYDKIDDKGATDINILIVNEALRQNVLGEAPLSSKVDVFDDNISRLSRCSKRVDMNIYIGSKEEIEPIRRVYDKVLLQLSHKGRIDPVKDIYDSLENHTQKVEAFIDHLILVGRPRGNCTLCLNQPICLP